MPVAARRSFPLLHPGPGYSQPAAELLLPVAGSADSAAHLPYPPLSAGQHAAMHIACPQPMGQGNHKLAHGTPHPHWIRWIALRFARTEMDPIQLYPTADDGA